jgi:hypothetical protein
MAWESIASPRPSLGQSRWNLSPPNRPLGFVKSKPSKPPRDGVVSPRPSPVVNHVLKGILIVFYRLVSQALISWRLMCLLGQEA